MGRMTAPEALRRLRQHCELTLVRAHWCVRVQQRPPEYEEILPAAAGQELVRRGVAVAEGRILRPA